MDFQEFDQKFPYGQFYQAHISGSETTGNRLTGCCPFHADRSPSFSVNLSTGQWKCFSGCGTGNVITFYSKIKGIDTGEAFHQLCDEYGFSHLIQAGEKHEKIQKTVLNDMPLLDQARMDALSRRRGWSHEVMEKLSLRVQTVYRSKDGEIKPVHGTASRVAIPVFNGRGDLVNIKLYSPAPKGDEPKNLPWGKGFQTAIFWPQLGVAVPDEGVIYVCEGEPDTICALSHGLNACTPLSKQMKWHRSSLKRFAGRDVVIIPDADIPGQKYAAAIAAVISEVAQSVKILVWPDFMGRDQITQQWPEKHGQDLTDFFVKHGKAIEDFHALFLDDLPKKPDLPETDDEFKQVVKGGDAYFSWRFPAKGDPKKVRVSNFVIDIVRVFRLPDGSISRGVRLKNITGQTVGPVECMPRDMSLKSSFSTWALKQGDFVWLGLQGDLEKMVELELRAADLKEIIKVDHVGWAEDQEMWLFPNFAVKDGEITLADADGVVWIDGVGYQVMPPTENQAMSKHLVPQIRCDISDEMIDRHRVDFLKAVKQNINNYGVYMALGIVPFCAYMPDLADDFENPLLFLTGQHQAGKNTLAKLILAHFGLSKRVAMSVHNITDAAMSATFSYYSCLPAWVDEFRSHEQSSKRFEGALRAMYDQTGGKRGSLTHEVVCKPVRSALIMTGEAYTDDFALASRCMQVYLSEKDRDDEAYPEVARLRPFLSSIFFKFLKDKTDQSIARLKKNIWDSLSSLKKQGMQTREATILAILYASFFTIYNPDDVNNDADNCAAWMLQSALDLRDTKIEENPVNEFLEDVVFLYQNGKIGPNHVQYDSWDDALKLWFPAVFAEWQKEMGLRRTQGWGRETILSCMKESPYYIKKDRVYINGTQRRGIILKGGKVPEHILAGLTAR